MFKYALTLLIINKDKKGKMNDNIEQSKQENEASVTESSAFLDRLNGRRDDGHLFFLCYNNNMPELDPIP